MSRPQTMRLGRRRRRLRRTGALLVFLALLAALLAWLYVRASRPETRQPGEALDDVTSRLSATLPAGAPLPRLVDVTTAAGLGDFVTFRGDRTSQLPEDMGSGVAWGDFDGDGDDDLFAVAAGGTMGAEPSPSQLYENLGDGRFRLSDAFPETRIHGMGAAWGDADGDGRLDLVVSGFDTLALYRNRDGRLELDSAFPSLPGFWAGVSWGDFDNDRDLDLYVCGYVAYARESAGSMRSSEQYGRAVPYTLNPASFEPVPNLLLRNDGGRFVEVAALLGVSNPGGRSLGALWHDVNADGWLDLYVANDISDNALYLNRQGETFEDASLAAWVADYRGAMGMATADYDRDGDDDIFVTHWVAQENALYSSQLVETQSADGSAPALRFSDRAAALGLGQIALQAIGWGVGFADFDADGWLDLAVSNGSTFETADSPPSLVAQESFLFWNESGRYFHDLAPASDAFGAPAVGRGLALADYDLDGDVDLVRIEHEGGLRLLRNDMATGNHLSLRLRSRDAAGTPSGRGEGAIVSVTVPGEDGPTILRRSVGGASYLSQDSATLIFGLADADRDLGIEVRWLGGDRERFEGLEANAIYELIEGSGTARRVEATPTNAAAVSSVPILEAENEKTRVARFWSLQRAAMDAMKRDSEFARAAGLFRQALALNPAHEDSRYYLASCLDAEGQPRAAIEELELLLAASPRSHRALKQLATLRAREAATREGLDTVVDLLERARAINREETGVLALLGEVELLRGEHAVAREHLVAASRTNRQAVGAFFLRAYLAYRDGDEAGARSLLEQSAAARGPGWKPEGAVAEGDTARRMYRERSPLADFWRRWDGNLEPAVVLAPLDRHLRQRGLAQGAGAGIRDARGDLERSP